MFSPEATGPANSIRNPRRRVRTTSEESTSTRKTPKRQKRSTLAPNTFEAPKPRKASSGKAKGKASKEQDPKPDNQQDNAIEATRLALRGRGNKRGDRERRPSKDTDGSILTRNDHYVITKETNIPEELSEIISRESWHVQVAGSLGHAVAFTPTKAIIWRISQKNSSAEPSNALTIKLGRSSASVQSTREPLPSGVLVHDSGVGELALFAVSATGKVTYWESVSSGVNAEFVGQKRQGLHGNVAGMLSGEVIKSVIEAEPDGFILTSSAGRVIHVSVRDPQGRPAINTQILRKDEPSSGGLFGSIRSAFSSTGWRRDIATVRAGPSRGKNQRRCIVATTHGDFQVWDLVRHANKTLETEINGYSRLRQRLMHAAPMLTNEDDLEVLDFTTYPNINDLEQEDWRLLILVSCQKQNRMHYFLMDINLQGTTLDVNNIFPITCWDRQQREDHSRSIFKPRVLLPRRAHTAFVIYDSFFIVASLGKVEETPNSQLQIESNTLSEPFQEVIRFLRSSKYHIVGCSVMPSEDNSSKATCSLFINDFGVVRATALPSDERDTAIERRAATCRSRLEQAIFFGGISRNLLDFRVGLDGTDWQDEEIENAALLISDSIINCSSSYIPKITPSMDQQLKQRASALEELIKLVRNRKLQRLTRWKLLWSAEKLASARALWKSYEAQLMSHGSKSDRKPLLPELLDMLSERYKHENRPELGETDIVRHYLVNDIAQIELIIPWAEKAIEELYKEGVNGPVEQALLVSQANDIQIGALEAAFNFREANAEVYGIGKDKVEGGVYQGDYHDLPEFWTSVIENLVKVKDLTDLARDFARDSRASDPDGENFDMKVVTTKIAKDVPRLSHLCCRIYDERCRFLQSSSDPQARAEGTALYRSYIGTRRELCVELITIDLAEEGMKLAERYRDVTALAEVVTTLSQLAVPLKTPTPNKKTTVTSPEQARMNAIAKLCETKITQLFDTYGMKWANAFYTQLIRQGALGEILSLDTPFVTEFLRSKPEFSKLSWINDVTSLKDYKRGMETLFFSQKHEKNLWGGKVQLSLAKLAALAANEKEQLEDEIAVKQIRTAERGLAIVDIQERLYEYARPSLRSAIDSIAELELAMEYFGGFVRKKPVLSDMLKKNLEKLVERNSLTPEELIDVLTLMTWTEQIQDEEDFMGERFYLAFQLLQLSDLDLESSQLYEKIIWRRCFIQDDWVRINRTEAKNDDEVAGETENTILFSTLYSGFSSEHFIEHPPLSPSDVVGAGSTTSSLRASCRFSDITDTTIKSLASEMAAEDRALAEAMRKGRLEKWWPGVVESAKVAARRAADEDGEEMAAKEIERQELEESLGGEMGETQADGLVDGREGANGEVDASGDVIMA